MVVITSSVEGFLADFLTPILPKIGREPTREGLIDIHRLISGNAAYMESNFRGGQHGHSTLTMTAEEYMEQTVFSFVPPQKPRRLPTEHGERPIIRAWNRKVPTNQVLFQK